LRPAEASAGAEVAVSLAGKDLRRRTDANGRSVTNPIVGRDQKPANAAGSTGPEWFTSASWSSAKSKRSRSSPSAHEMHSSGAMLCQDIMKRTVEFVLPSETAQVAARRMKQTNIGFLPVCDDARKVLGTITDRDLAMRVLAEDRPATTRVEELMTRENVSCRPSDDVRWAERLMAKHHKSRIMCVDERGSLVGVISLSDIADREERGRAALVMRCVSEREISI
jgi:CBS domain-containing protein